MEQATQLSTWILIAFNVLMGIVAFLGSSLIRRMEAEMIDLRRQQTEQAKTTSVELANKVDKHDFRDFREELRQNFRDIFDRMDALRDRIPGKIT